MAQIAAEGVVVPEPRSGLSAKMALRVAWVAWIILLIIPFLVSMAMIWQVAIEAHGAGAGAGAIGGSVGHGWFLMASGYLLLAGPLSFFWRGRVFKAYATGKPVSPEKYLFGMLVIWMALEIGGLFSLAGCFVDNSPLPNLIPALVAFMFFVTFWPSGRAMAQPTGQYDDPGIYHEPS
jgi:hypothetical protein